VGVRSVAGRTGVCLIACDAAHALQVHGPAAWRMLFLGYCYEFPVPQEQFIKGEQGLIYMPSYSPKCLHGYATTREARSQRHVRITVPPALGGSSLAP